MKTDPKALLMLILAAVFWSTSGVLIKLTAMPPLYIAGWRSLVAAFVILVLCRKEIRISFNADALIAAACMGLFCIFFVWATKLGTAANAIVLQYSASAYVAVLAPVFINEPTRRQDWLFLVIVMIGIGLFFLDDLTIQGVRGILIGVVGSIFWALANIFLRKSKDRSTAWPLVLGNFMAAGLCLPVMFTRVPGFSDALGILGLGVISIGAGYAIYSYAIKRVQALEAILICSIEPLINPIWVVVFAGEIPGPASLVGGALVLCAVTLRGLLMVARPAEPAAPAPECRP